MTATLLLNGRAHTLRREGERVEGLAVEDGTIVSLGSSQELRDRYRSANYIDLEGRAVIPGLTDSHLHLMSYGQQLTRLDLSETRSISELMTQVRTHAAQLEPGEWLLGRGWDQDLFREGRYPSRHDLDAAAPRVPVFLRRACGHAAVASSAVLEMAGLDASTPDPPGGRYDRDPQTGELTGVMRETAMEAVYRVLPQPNLKHREHALRQAIERAWQAGLTAVHANDVGSAQEFAATWDLYRNVIGTGARAMPFRLYLDTGIDALEAAQELDLVTGSGNDYLRFGSIKLFADGSLGASTAALYEDYADDPGNRGILVKSESQLVEEIGAAHRAGMQVAIHAIGDRAAGVALKGITSALAAEPRADHRHRLIHCQILNRDIINQMAAAGVVADVQPKFVTTDMRWAERRVGPERAKTTYAWRTLKEAGVPLAFGSDAPVEPIEPFLGVYAAVTRRDMGGYPRGGWLPEQKLSVYEALRGFALGGAYAEFADKQRGTLEPGKLADLVVLDRDPFECPDDELRDIRPVMTIVGGEVVYNAL